MALFGSFICEKLGLPCPHAGWGGKCLEEHCVMQGDADIDELDLFDMLDEEEE